MLRIVGEVGRATAAVRAPRSLHTTRRRAQDLHRATLAALLVVAKSVNRISTSETDRRIERGAEVLPGSYSSCTSCRRGRPVWPSSVRTVAPQQTTVDQVLPEAAGAVFATNVGRRSWQFECKPVITRPVGRPDGIPHVDVEAALGVGESRQADDLHVHSGDASVGILRQTEGPDLLEVPAIHAAGRFTVLKRAEREDAGEPRRCVAGDLAANPLRIKLHTPERERPHDKRAD